MRNLKLILEYDGTDFKGSQLQLNGRTVQGELEKAVGKLTGLEKDQRCVVSLAGRTDSGVHATGQVANFRTESKLSLEPFQRGLNALLPDDIAVRQMEEVADSFHSRFSAIGRSYSYRLLNQKVRSPLEKRFAYHLTAPLSVEKMAEAAYLLTGEQDFASFAGDGWGSNPGAEEKSKTIRRMTKAVCQWENEIKRVCRVELAANAFLPHMVRNIVGTLLMVGKGDLTLAGFAEILAARDRRLAGPTAPACGLCLTEVQY